jgi:uncharacterized membrane protein
MESRAKLFGHALHQQLIVFPLGLLATSVIFDIIYMITGNATLAEVAFWMIAAGVIGGLLAAIFGLVDWLAIPAGTRAKAVGLWHGVGNVIVTGLFALSWFARADAPRDPGYIAHTTAIVGVLLALVTGWLGGELVDRLRVGIDDGAHLNSPNSLSGRPAEENAAPTNRGRGGLEGAGD